jgi:putative acetyltransferase
MIRPYRPDDFDPVNDLWRRSRLHAFAAFHASKGHTADEDRDYFRRVVLPRHDLWVAELDGHPVGFMAIRADFIDQLYIDPDHQRRGIGSALMAHAKALSPSGLRLFTFQINAGGRAFYAKHGFEVVRFGVSPPPESEPDVEYHWRPYDE